MEAMHRTFAQANLNPRVIYAAASNSSDAGDMVKAHWQQYAEKMWHTAELVDSVGNGAMRVDTVDVFAREAMQSWQVAHVEQVPNFQWCAMKIDVEGLDGTVLQGSMKILDQVKVVV